MKTKLLLAFLALAFSNSSVSAAIYDGTCGANVTWTLNTYTGVLEIEGTGVMDNYSTYSAPWYNYRSSITQVEIANGVTTIGTRAFYDCENLSFITIPSGLTSIGWAAFYDCKSLSSITIPNSVNRIENSVFSD